MKITASLPRRRNILPPPTISIRILTAHFPDEEEQEDGALNDRKGGALALLRIGPSLRDSLELGNYMYLNFFFSRDEAQIQGDRSQLPALPWDFS